MKLDLGETPLELFALVPIAHVVLSGLQPLRDAALRDLPPKSQPEPDGGRRVTATYKSGEVPEEDPYHGPPENISVRATFTVPDVPK